MRSDLPPVKPTTSATQIKVDIKLASGADAVFYVDDGVAGKYHVLVPAYEFWITLDELEDAKKKMKEGKEKKRNAYRPG